MASHLAALILHKSDGCSTQFTYMRRFRSTPPPAAEQVHHVPSLPRLADAAPVMAARARANCRPLLPSDSPAVATNDDIAPFSVEKQMGWRKMRNQEQYKHVGGTSLAWKSVYRLSLPLVMFSFSLMLSFDVDSYREHYRHYCGCPYEL